jgi:hypothetical protein
MKLSRLSIELQTYGEYRGRYLGTIAFEDREVGSVCLTLDPDLASALLATCSANIVAVSTKASQQLQKILEQSIAEAKQGPALTA